MNETAPWPKKVKRLLQKANAPEFLHHYGPKTYHLWQHVLVLAIRQECKLGYRRACKLLTDFGFTVPTYSAISKIASRLPTELWNKIKKATLCAAKVAVASVDASTFSRSIPSYHYLRRIDRSAPYGRPVKTTFLVDTRTRKILDVVCRVIPRHDVLDVPKVLKNANILTLVADKGYDSEKIHALCYRRGIKAMIPRRRRVKKGFYRRKMAKLFRMRTYHRRETSESVFARVKQCYGNFVRCRSARTIRAEIYMRVILHNLAMLF